MATWNPFKKKAATPTVTPAPRKRPEELADALLDMRRRLEALYGDSDQAGGALAFARSLLAAVGENPATLENQVVAHQIALEQLRITRSPARLN